MPRACTICSHPDRKTIDARIANKEPYLRIAKRFGLNDVTVRSHAKKHVNPVIDNIELQANAAVLERVMAYRDEVNLPLPEKSKYIENKLWDDYWMLEKPVERMAVMREIAKQQQEQAKLAGAYIKDADNPADLKSVARTVAEFRQRIATDAEIYAATDGKYGHPMPDGDWIAGEEMKILKLHKVLPEQLATEMGKIG